MGHYRREAMLAPDEDVDPSVIHLVATVEDSAQVVIDIQLDHHEDRDTIERLCNTFPTGIPSPTLAASVWMAGCNTATLRRNGQCPISVHDQTDPNEATRLSLSPC